MNELHSKFEPRGLSIVGVTGESARETEPWVAEQGVRYGYAYDKGGKLARKLGIQGIPHAVLVDPKGIVRWRGHPGQLTDQMIEEQLAKTEGLALDVQLLCKKLPDSAGAVKEPLQKGQFGKAIAAAKQSAATDPAAKEWLAELDAIVQSRIARVTAKRTEGDFLAAVELAKELEQQLAGAPQAQAVAAQAKAITGDKAAAAVLAAQKQLQAIGERIAKAKKAKEMQGLVATLEQIKRKHEGTYAAAQALELLSKAEQRRPELR